MDSILSKFSTSYDNSISWFKRQPLIYKVGLICGLIFYLIVSGFLITHYSDIIKYIVEVSDSVKESGFKGVLVFILLLGIVSFPPFIGFASLCIVIGIVYGFKGYWIILITSSTMSTLSLCLFKYYFKDASREIIHNNSNLKLFVSVIKDENTSFMEEIFILLLMKLCPLPYSITNGGLGCVPHLSPLAFFIACVLCSPKYLIQLFMGIQLRKIGNGNEDNHKRMVDFIIFMVTGISFAGLSLLLYKRLQMKIRERRYIEEPDDTDEELAV